MTYKKGDRVQLFGKQDFLVFNGEKFTVLQATEDVITISLEQFPYLLETAKQVGTPHTGGELNYHISTCWHVNTKPEHHLEYRTDVIVKKAPKPYDPKDLKKELIDEITKIL